NRPFPTQYGLYVWHALHGDFGSSWQSGNPVATDLRQRLPATLELITYSLLLAVLIAIPLRVRAARKPGKASERFAFGYGLVAVLYSFLIGGAVLVEFVFGWGGAGQYAVQGVLNADFQVVQGFVLVAAVISLVVYLLVDLIYLAIDPRLTR